VIGVGIAASGAAASARQRRAGFAQNVDRTPHPMGTPMPDVQHTIARARGTGGPANYAVAIRAGRHDLTADEPPIRGGADAGASPYELVLSGLVACTAITLRMYAQRKGWKLARVQAEALFIRQAEASHIERRLRLEGDLAPDQIARLLEIAERTPVTLTLKEGLAIHTELRSDGDPEAP
jgi:putative redox protein